jgi:Zn-dependent protease with chaperone function
LLIVTALTPLTFRGKFRTQPNLGIALWLGLFLSGVLSILSVGVVSIWSLFELVEVGADSKLLPLELASNMGIWALLALAGITLAQINQRTEPLAQEASAIRPELAKTGSDDGAFSGFPLRHIELSLPLLFVSGRSIYLSAGTRSLLSAAELEAALWHEVGHIRGRHESVKALAKLAQTLTPRIRASRIMANEIDTLAEIAADRYASSRVAPEVLASARAKFLE